MELENGPCEDYVRLQTGGFPLPMLVSQSVYKRMDRSTWKPTHRF